MYESSVSSGALPCRTYSDKGDLIPVLVSAPRERLGRIYQLRERGQS
jgi:hypothetical protein